MPAWLEELLQRISSRKIEILGLATGLAFARALLARSRSSTVPKMVEVLYSEFLRQVDAGEVTPLC